MNTETKFLLVLFLLIAMTLTACSERVSTTYTTTRMDEESIATVAKCLETDLAPYIKTETRRTHESFAGGLKTHIDYYYTVICENE